MSGIILELEKQQWTRSISSPLYGPLTAIAGDRAKQVKYKQTELFQMGMCCEENPKGDVQRKTVRGGQKKCLSGGGASEILGRAFRRIVGNIWWRWIRSLGDIPLFIIYPKSLRCCKLGSNIFLSIDLHCGPLDLILEQIWWSCAKCPICWSIFPCTLATLANENPLGMLDTQYLVLHSKRFWIDFEKRVLNSEGGILKVFVFY